MYLIPIGVPIFRGGGELLLQTDWRRALVLLRDSLGGRYGDLVLLSPWLPADGPEAKVQRLEPLAGLDGVRALTAHDARVRARRFWSREVGPWRRLVDRQLESAQVLHGGLDELFRPMMGIAVRRAFARGVPTVFVQDTDVVVQMPELAGQGALAQARAKLYVTLFERLCRRAVARADLTFLKSGSLARRYAPYAKNLKEIEDTSYLSSEIAPEADVRARAAELPGGRPLKLVYCGRLVERKGVHVSLDIVAEARRLGANVEFEVIGSGPEETRLAERVRELGLVNAVRLSGAAAYGPELLERLARADGLLFTPTAEDTPRMIFDGYAAGLPLVAAAIPYVEERARREQATWLLPRGDVRAAGEALARLDRRRGELVALTEKALAAAQYHAADAWYARRAEWTHEAVERYRAARG